MGLNVKDVKLGVIGCGKMASAILGGVCKNQFLNPENVFVFDINLDASAKMCAKYGFNEVLSLNELLDNVDVILLAVKPFVFHDVLLEIKEFYKDQPIISILAGVKMKKFNFILSEAPIVRVMPNTPALVNEGMSAICKNEFVDEYWSEFSMKLMKNCGKIS